MPSLVAPELARAAAEHAQKREGSAEPSGCADMLLHQPEGWTAYQTLWRQAAKALEDRLGRKDEHDRPLDRRNVLVIGCGGLAQAFIYGVQRNKGIVSVTAANENGAPSSWPRSSTSATSRFTTCTTRWPT